MKTLLDGVTVSIDSENKPSKLPERELLCLLLLLLDAIVAVVRRFSYILLLG